MIKANIKELLFSFKSKNICYYQFCILTSKLQGTYVWLFLVGWLFFLAAVKSGFSKKKAKCFQSAGVIHNVTENNQSLNLLLWAFRPDFMKDTFIHI